VSVSSAGPADVLERLHPVVLHHIVNTLRWPGLRPLQQASVAPLLDGVDALLLAPTAGGKTEAAAFPLLSKMAEDEWSGTSLLYVCPLKALLNNLHPRLDAYAGWLGRRAAVWHGDIRQSRRQAILRTRPDILLTTPESLEAMLVSANVDHDRFFSGLRAIVVDEVHAFAGDDRGWHLLAVLERLERVAGRTVQRVGLSATVGNPSELLTWLQGSGAGKRSAQVVAPHLSAATAAASAPADLELDYVGSVANAARVIAAMHKGEKRLVFCDSRRLVEELGHALRESGVTTFLSHASLSADERRRSEEAFASARDCVIVATSTLELGIDVGDLDRVIQINAPSTVAGFLQRLGRTGRRPGSVRNCLFLALSEPALVQAAALLLLWSRDWVEPVVAPPEPRHIAAQQLLALCLQEKKVGDNLWREGWNGLPMLGPSAEPILRHLVAEGFLDRDGGMLFIGPEAEKRFGFRHFMDLTAVFTAPPQFAVLFGRQEIGRTDPQLLTEKIDGPRRLLLAGRTWVVTYIDWARRRCFVEPADGRGKARWGSDDIAGLSYQMTRAMRDVLLGADPPVAMTKRAIGRLAGIREDHLDVVHPGGTLITRGRNSEVRWWTWAGIRANACLTSTLAGVADPVQQVRDTSIRLREDLSPHMWRTEITEAASRLCLPTVDERAVRGLKFSAALPERLAVATLAARMGDADSATLVLREPARIVL
jgi:ATP-dependent helicase Lhr and Lhr-like helicase